MPSSTSAPSQIATFAGSDSRRAGTLRERLGHPGVFLGVILTAQLMVVLDTTIVNVALPHIQRGLGFSTTSLSWVINAYILTFGGLMLLGARAGDLVGRRRIFLTGIALFSVSSLAGGFALTSWMLLTSRAIQGIGAALAAPTALSLLTAVFPEGPARLRAIALYTTMSAAGGATGLVAGGLLTELVSWRWVMFVNVPIGLAVFLIGREVIGETQPRRGRFDLIGAVTSTLGVTALVLGFVQAGSDGWTDPVTVGAFSVGLVLLGVFVHAEARAEEPILPLRLFAHRTRTTANVARGLLYAGMYGLFFYLGQFFQDVQGYSPLRAGVAFLPMPASVFLASQLTSRVLSRRLPEKTLMILGATLATLGLFLAADVHLATSYVQLLAGIVLMGVGSGVCFVSLTSASLHDVQPQDAGAASGLVNVSQQLGAALGLAVLVTAYGTFTSHAAIIVRGTAVALAASRASMVRGVDDVFRVGLVFTISALVLIAVLVRRSRAQAVAPELASSASQDADFGELPEWLEEDARESA
jgi:EmrB/QacA subfamily drug resistance transporter